MVTAFSAFSGHESGCFSLFSLVAFAFSGWGDFGGFCDIATRCCHWGFGPLSPDVGGWKLGILSLDGL